MGWKEISREQVINYLKKDIPKRVLNKYLGNIFLINSSHPQEVICVSSDIYSFFNIIKSKGIQPLFLGEKICDVGEVARLSLPFSKKLDLRPKVYVNYKAEQLFLYGRDIYEKSIVKIDGEPKKDKLVFIYSRDGIFLGLGFYKKNSIKHVIDIGHYLRCERKKKKRKKSK